MPLYKPGPYDENVTRKQLRALVAQDSLDLVDRDGMRRDGRRWLLAGMRGNPPAELCFISGSGVR